MQFANPSFLWLFFIFVPLIVWYVLKQRNERPTMALSTLRGLDKCRPTWRVYMRHSLFVLRLLTVGCLIIILARPLLPDDQRTTRSVTSVDGTDIVIALDISASMLARDLDPDRLLAAKKVAKKFIDGRSGDNIGLVIFAGESLTAIPLTTDREALKNYIDNIDIDVNKSPLGDGTSIGDGIGTAINAIKSGIAKSKSIILITDGSNNTGLLTPRDAGMLAKQKGIKVYTIGVGTIGMADYPAIDEFGRKTFVKQKVVIEEDVLKDISKETSAKYFRATDSQVLSDIFSVIDRLEKTHMDVENFTHEEDDPGIWPWLALGLFLLELGLRYTIFRTGP